MTKNNNNHCVKCSTELKKSVKRAYSKYRCIECNRYVSSISKQCLKHPETKSIEEKYPESEIIYKCTSCGYKPLKGKSHSKPVDRLQRVLQYSRQFKSSLKNLDDPKDIIYYILDHIEKYNPKSIIKAFNSLWLPDDEIDDIKQETGCDKWVEKSFLRNIVLWSLGLFFQKQTKTLTIQEIADASGSLLGRSLTESSSVNNRTLSTRFEKEKLIAALEMILQLCSAQLSPDLFNETGHLVNIYYDWFYVIKSGEDWQICQSVGSQKTSQAIKIGVGIEWETMSIVALTVSGEYHANDSVDFRNNLMVTQREGIVHITDMGPFSTETMLKIKQLNQYFIIKLKANIQTTLIHHESFYTEWFYLDTKTKTKIKLLQCSLVRLNAKPDLGHVRYIRFQYWSEKTKKFQTVKLISSLPLSAEEIVRLHAWRWVATETEFRTIQHQFGFERLKIKKPEKIWPLLLLTLSGKMLMELTYKSIHLIHGGEIINMKTAEFRRGFNNFMTAVLTGIEDPKSQINPCNKSYCCFRRPNGRRWK